MFIPLLLLWTATASPGSLADDEDEPPVIPAMPLEEAVTKVRRWVFQHPLLAREDGSKLDPLNAEEAIRLMDPFVRKKIAVVDQVCALTVVQKEKLRLAGHGDHKRLIDRVEKMGAQLQLAENDGERQIELQKSARLLSNGLIWLCSDDSLFAKTVERVLTPEQASKYRPLRDALRAGCHVGLNRLGPVDGLEVIIARTSFADEDLQRLCELPGIQMLTLAHLPITDAGLAHLQGLVGLRYLQLDDIAITDAGLAHVGRLRINYLSIRNTRIDDDSLRHIARLKSAIDISIDSPLVTDAGLAHLSELSNLLSLSLRRTRVTADGVTELKQALPRLEVHGR